MANSAFNHSPTITVPSPTVNNRVVTWNGTTGKVFHNAATVTIAAGVVDGVTALTVDNLTIDGNTITSTDTNGNITLTPHGTGSVVMDTMTFNGNLLDVRNNGTASAIRLYCEDNNQHYQEIKAAPHSGAADYSIILPGAAPTAAGKVLKSSGSSPYSTLEWGDAGGNAFTNDVTVTSGNVVMATAGKGIDFSAQTPSSSGTLVSGGEVFDHYEEGTFSPVANVSTGSLMTSVVQYGHYTRIGNRVLFNFRITATKGSASNSAKVQITGLPFTMKGESNAEASFVIGYINPLAITAGWSLNGVGEQGTDRIHLAIWNHTQGNAVNRLTVTQATQAGGETFFMNMSGQYEID